MGQYLHDDMRLLVLYILDLKLLDDIPFIIFVLLQCHDIFLHICIVKQCTLPTGEILSGENARKFLVCGFLMKSYKKYPENIKKIVVSV